MIWKTSRRGVTADVRLNPSLERHCHEDINKLCSAELSQLSPGKESGGKVLLCLRRHYVKKVRQLLSAACFNEVFTFMT